MGTCGGIRWEERMACRVCTFACIWWVQVRAEGGMHSVGMCGGIRWVLVEA